MNHSDPGFDVPLTPEETVSLLGRDLVSINLKEVASQSILVTGAGGSIGRDLVLRLLHRGHHVTALDKNENGLFRLQQMWSESEIQNAPNYLVVNLGDYDVVRDIFEKHEFQTVIHCAAHKHVGLMELNEIECWRNNLDHTLHLYRCAEKVLAERFIFLSTDKSVGATCVMGRTKAEAEKRLTEMSDLGDSAIVLSIVRLPNVIGSDGSVAQVFRRQAKLGKPFTVTDSLSERLFISNSYACEAIESALVHQPAGIIVPTEHVSIRIVDLAQRAHALWGQDGEPQIVITQLGKGERLRESLVGTFESLSPWVVPQLGLLSPKDPSPDED